MKQPDFMPHQTDILKQTEQFNLNRSEKLMTEKNKSRGEHMKIQKYAALVKKKQYCVWVNGASGVFLGLPEAFYRASNIPRAETDGEIRAVLDIEKKKWEKIHLIKNFGNKADHEMLMFDFSNGTAIGEKSAEPMELAAVDNGTTYGAIRCEDNTLLFYNKDLLAPLADILKDDEGYITFRVRRTLENDKDVIVIKNGFEVVACILPVKVLSRGYIAELQDFLVLCVDQYHREKGEERRDDV